MVSRSEGPMSSSIEPNYMYVGRRIRELRIHNSLSPVELAGRTGLTAGYIMRLEDGLEVPEYETLQVLAQAVAVPVYRLFSRGEGPLTTPRLTPRPTLDELVVESCVRSKASSVWGTIRGIALGRIRAGLNKLLPSFADHRPANGSHKETGH